MRLSPVNLAKLNDKEMLTYWNAGISERRRQYLCWKDNWVRVRYIDRWDEKWIVNDGSYDDYSELKTFDEVYEIFLN